MILGPQEEVIKCCNRLKDQFSSIGLEMREDKCEVFSSVGIQNWDLNIPIKQDGLIILASPVRSLSFTKNTCAKQVNSAKSFLSKLPQINDAQSAILIFRYCGIPKYHIYFDLSHH